MLANQIDEHERDLLINAVEADLVDGGRLAKILNDADCFQDVIDRIEKQIGGVTKRRKWDKIVQRCQTEAQKHAALAQRKPTAAETYAQHRADIARLMDWITLEMDSHRSNAKANPENWGYAGDLGHVRQKLIEALVAISTHRPDTVEERLRDGR